MNSDDARLFEHVRPWLERQLGFSIRAPDASVQVAAAPSREGEHPLFAVRAGAAVAVAARQEWLDALRLIVEELHPDILFSIAGAYELSRVTLADEVWVFGPVAVYVADETAWRPVDDIRPRRLAAVDLETVDWDTFWHCTGTGALGHFGIYEDQRLVAASRVNGERRYEVIDAECIGCNLCMHICSVDDCITMVEVDNGKPYMNWTQDPRNPMSGKAAE